jgi:Domain of unknown function (DUF4386)
MATTSTSTVIPSSTFEPTHDVLRHTPVAPPHRAMREDQRPALLAGLAYLGLLITGALGYMFVRGELFVDDDAAKTAANLVRRESLARAGVALDIGAALTQALVAVALFALFRRAHRWFAAAVAALGLVGSTALMTAAVFSWSALDAALSGSVDDAYLLYRLQGASWDVGGIVFGLWLLPLGWLVLRTSPMPRMLGWLLLVGALGYVANTYVRVLAPDATSLADALLIPSAIGELWMIGYLLWRGLAGQLSLVPRVWRSVPEPRPDASSGDR